MSFLRGLPFIPYQTPKFSKEDQAKMDDYNKQIEAYSKAVDDYNAYIEKWNAGPRTEDPTMQPPKELPFTQAELDTFSEAAANTAQKTAAQRELALAVMANPQQYNLAGFGFADGGEASKARLAYNKMFPQKFVVGGPAMAVQNAAAMMAPPAGAPAAEVSPSALQQFMNMITGETARREAETEAYLSQPIEQPAAQRLDPAAYAEALRSVQESRITGGVIAPDADEREKTRREMERLSRPGGFAPAASLPPTPGFEPITVDTSPSVFPETEKLPTAMPGAEPPPQSVDDFIMRSQANQVSARNALDAFTRQTIQDAERDSREKSREVVVEMDIDNFLNLAAEGKDAQKEAALKDVDQFNQIPFLSTEGEQVVGHEGRNRARRMKELGYTTMPVRIIDKDVRWGENPEVRFDTLKAQEGAASEDFSIEHPVKPGEFGTYWNQAVDTIRSEYGSLKVYTDIENQRDNRPLINDFLVKEGKRNQGYGKELLQNALTKYPNAGAMVGSEASLKAMYDVGMRSQDYPRASLDELKDRYNDDGFLYMVAQPSAVDEDYFRGGVLEPEQYANGGEVTQFLRKRAEGSPPEGELSPEDRQTQLDTMRDMMLAEKVAAYLGPNNERGEFNPEEFYPHMLGRGNDYNVKVTPGGLASPSWNKEGSIPYTSLETGERTEYPIRPGTINTYGRDSYDPYVIAHEIDHDERHKWDVFAANLNEDEDKAEENRVRRNDVLYAQNEKDWKRAVNNYVNSAYLSWVRDMPFEGREEKVLENLAREAIREPESFPESRLGEDAYWRVRYKELNPSLLDSITEWLSSKVKKRANGSPEEGEMSTDEFIRQLVTEGQAVQDAERTRGEYLEQAGKEQKYENVYDALFRRNVDVKTNEDYRPDLLPIFRGAAVRAVMSENPTAGVDYEHYPALPSGRSARGVVSDRKSRSKMTAADELSLVNDAIKSIGGGTLKTDGKGNLYLTDYYDFNMTDPTKIRDLYGAQRFGMGALDKLGMLHNYRTELNLGNKYDLFKGLSKEEVDAALQRAKVQTFTPQGRKVVNPEPIGGTPDGA